MRPAVMTPVQRLKDFSDAFIDPETAVAPFPVSGFPEETLRCLSRVVGCIEGEVEKEGLVRMVGAAILEKPDRFGDEAVVHGVALHFRIGHEPRFVALRVSDDAIVADEKRDAWRVGRNDETGVEAEMRRPEGDRLGMIDASTEHADCSSGPHLRDPVKVAGIAGDGDPVEAEMPFAEGTGEVAFRLEEGGESQALFRNHRFSVGREHSFANVSALGVATGQQRVARGRAHGMRREGIRESQTIGGDGIDLRRLKDGLRIVTARIAPAEIIGENENDVGTVGCSRFIPRNVKTDRSEEMKDSMHPAPCPGSSRTTMARSCHSHQRMLAGDRREETTE